MIKVMYVHDMHMHVLTLPRMQRNYGQFSSSLSALKDIYQSCLAGQPAGGTFTFMYWMVQTNQPAAWLKGTDPNFPRSEGSVLQEQAKFVMRVSDAEDYTKG